LRHLSRWTPGQWKWPVSLVIRGGVRVRHHDAHGLQIAADRFAPDTRRPLDAPQRPSQSPQRHNLVVFVVSQDVAHAA
jgi:hypothetical protein